MPASVTVLHMQAHLPLPHCCQALHDGCMLLLQLWFSSKVVSCKLQLLYIMYIYVHTPLEVCLGMSQQSEAPGGTVHPPMECLPCQVCNTSISLCSRPCSMRRWILMCCCIEKPAHAMWHMQCCGCCCICAPIRLLLWLGNEAERLVFPPSFPFLG